MDRMNAAYLDSETMAQIHDAFCEDEKVPSVLLSDFLAVDFLPIVKKEIDSLSFTQDDAPLYHSCYVADPPRSLVDLFESPAFLAFVSGVIGKNVIGVKAKTYRFSSGHYTLIHGDIISDPGIDLVLDLTAGWDPDFGGSVVYVDGSGDYKAIPPASNSITLAERKADVQKFVQYVNHLATKKRYLILGSLRVDS